MLPWNVAPILIIVSRIFAVNYVTLRPNVQLKEHNYQSVTKVLNLKSNKCRICSENIFFHCYECLQVMAVKSVRSKCQYPPLIDKFIVILVQISSPQEVSSKSVREMSEQGDATTVGRLWVEHFR